MQRSIVVVVVALVALIAVGVAVGRWKAAKNAADRDARWAAIRSVVDTTKGAGWVETFTSDRSMPLTEYDPRWRLIFGRMLVDRRLGGLVGDPDGGWQRDGGDDYAFRATGVPTGSVEITMDAWWDGNGAIGAQGAVQPDPPHRLYEAALWRGRLVILYFRGPAPDQFDILAESASLEVTRGHYRIVFRLQQNAGNWQLSAKLLNPRAGYQLIHELSATDGRLPGGGQGVGILGGGASSYISGIAVRGL